MKDLFGLDKAEAAVMFLQMTEPKPEGFYLAFSGGKDSITIYELARLAGVKFDAHYNITTVDPPELVRFVRENYPEVKMERPKRSMWQLIEKHHMPPLRRARYCCRELKEHGGEGRVVITGVRAAESFNRRSRKMMDTCPKTGKTIVNLIVNWEESDVWDFIKSRGLPYPSLYDEGFSRLGCVGCPMASSGLRKKELQRWPKIAALYMRSFEKLLKERPFKKIKAKTAQEVMDWWLHEPRKESDEEQPLFS